MAQGEIKTITEMDLQLTEKLAGLSVTLEFIKQAQADGFAATNDHLKELNGKVLKQEKELDSHSRQLNNFEGFKDSVEKGAQDKAGIEARKIANRSASIRSVIVSVISFILTAAVAVAVLHYFHIAIPLD